MRAILVNQMMRIDEQHSQILRLFLKLVRVDRERADQLKEVQKYGFGDFLEVEGAIECPCWGDG